MLGRGERLARDLTLRAALIVNPLASNVTEERVAAVERVLRPVVTLLTEHRGHAAQLAQNVEADAIVVYSGDGVFNEVLNGVRRDVPIGFLPGGGTSVLPRALGLPRDPVAAARVVAGGRWRRISLGRVNGRRFAFSAGIGLDAEAVRRVDALGRGPDGRRPGDLAFVHALLAIGREQRFRLPPELEVAGLGRASAVFVSNGPVYTYAGRLPLRFSPHATFEGGLDLAGPIVAGPLALAGRLARVAAGRGLDGISGHDLDGAVVRSDRPLPLQADGEDLGDVTEAVLEAERGAVRVLLRAGEGSS
jgi:diacylglycerol kinase family enzyme